MASKAKGRQLLARGIEEEQRGHLERARKLYRKVTAANPSLHEGWTRRAGASARLGDLGDAASSYAEALAHGRAPAAAVPALQMVRGRVLAMQGRPKDALAAYRAAVSALARQAVALHEEFRGGEGGAAMAGPSVAERRAADGAMATALLARGNALWELGQPRKALRDYEKALGIEPRPTHEQRQQERTRRRQQRQRRLQDGDAWPDVPEPFRAAAAAMPRAAQQLLLEHADPSALRLPDGAALLAALRLPAPQLAAAAKALASPLVVLRRKRALPPAACARLRLAMDAHRRPPGVDTVDGAPDYQRNLSLEELRALVGDDAACDGLLALPAAFAARLAERDGGYVA